LWGTVQALLRAQWAPEQIAGILAEAFPDAASYRVSHETIYSAVYLVPRGALRTELIACLHKAAARANHARAGQIPHMQSIHVRLPEVDDHLIPGPWEGDLIEGAGNRSSVGTRVERTRIRVLAKMSSTSAADALESFGEALKAIPEVLGKTLTYDQGKEMSYHGALTLRTGVRVSFVDPHSSWQRSSNENTNGLLRQYLPKGTNLSVYSQAELNQIVLSINTRSRKRYAFRTPLQVYNEHLRLAEANDGTAH